MNRRKASPKSSANSLPSGESLGQELSTAVVLFHEAIASQLGMSATEWKCLGLLDQHGPSTAGKLAQLSGFTTGAITGIVDRLEQAGYAKREPNPNDRRSIIICAQGLGEFKQRVGPIFASLGRAMGTLAGRYRSEELAAIQSYLEGMIQVLRDETRKLTAPPA